LRRHQLDVVTSAGTARSVALAARPVADFYAEVTRGLDELGVGTEIWPVPVEIEGAIPVHLFWGGLDLAVTRFSGRPVPPHPGRPPHCGPQVMLEAYSHEVSSAGYWPGGEGRGFFYSCSYPEPDGYRESAVRPADAFYSQELGEFLLPYEAAAARDNPRHVLLEFLQGTYEAAANCASWDRAALERHG
jgi:Family of unknown function (DUF5996)